MKKNTMYPYSMVVPSIVVYTAFFILPILAAFALSFTRWNIEDIFHPKFIGIENFQYLFSHKLFLLSLKNTFIFALATTVLKTVFGLLLALAATKPLLSRMYLRSIFYLPSILSSVAVGLIFTAIFQMEGGTLNQFISVFIKDFKHDWLGDTGTAMISVIFTEVWRWSGFVMSIFIAGLIGIPTEYYEASRVDGASPLQQLFHITIPLLVPAFTVVLTLNLVGGMKVFDQVYVLTNGGPADMTSVFALYTYRAFSSGILGQASAAGLVQSIIIIVFGLSINLGLKKKEEEL